MHYPFQNFGSWFYISFPDEKTDETPVATTESVEVLKDDDEQPETQSDEHDEKSTVDIDDGEEQTENKESVHGNDIAIFLSRQLSLPSHNQNWSIWLL